MKNLWGTSREGKKGQICLKFGTLIGLIFILWKILFLCPGTWSWTLSGLKTFGHSREAINGQICLKFSTLKAWVNSWKYLFHFFENLDFGALGTHCWTLIGALGTQCWTLNELKTFGLHKGRHNGQNLREIWRIYSLGESLGVFFSVFENFGFWALGTGSS